MAGMRYLRSVSALVLINLLCIPLVKCDQGGYSQESISNEIIEKLSKGEDINLNNTLIKGDLDLSHVDFSHNQGALKAKSKIIYSNLVIKDSKIEGAIRFSGTTFVSPVNFQNTTFAQAVDLSNSIFEDNTAFGTCHFLDDAKFDFCDFEKDGIFSSSNFKNNAFFRWCTFKGTGDFFKTYFDRDAYFVGSRFIGIADFIGSIFQGYAYISYFWPTFFYNTADFSKSQFANDAHFEGTQFDRSVLFDQTKFNDHAYFGDASFKGLISFNYTQMIKEIYFDGAIFDRLSKLSLDRAKLSKLYLRYDNIKDHLFYDEEMYLFLVQNYKNIGWHDDSNNCYYDYRIKHPINPLGDPIQFIYDRASLISYGYGVKPIRPLVLSIFIILVSGIIFYFSNGLKRSSTLPDQGQTISIWDSIHYSATAFTSGASAFISNPTEIIPVGKAKYLVTAERFLGWIFFSLFLITLANTAVH